MVATCIVCRASSDFEHHAVPRHRYGVNGTAPVPYLECRGCRSLSIARIPDDLENEYGPGYHVPIGSPRSPRRLLRRFRGKHAVGGRSWIGRVLSEAFPDALERFDRLLQLANAERGSRILDVGAGNGEILARLAAAGYRSLTGVDPFLPADAAGVPHARMIRSELGSLAETEAGQYDLVMFNHSLEHVPDPETMLVSACRMLAPSGRILVRLPVAGCEAWDRYRTAWVQIDAPRHLFIPSRTGMRLLAERVGLRLQAAMDDSTEIQFLGSELYRRGRPFHDLPSEYGWATRRRFRREARALNERARGDQVGFVFSVSAAGPPG